MRVQLDYGRTGLEVALPEDRLPNPEAALEHALQQPEHRSLASLVRAGMTVLDTGLREDVLRRGVAKALPALAAYLFLRCLTSPAEASSVAFASPDPATL